MRRILVALLAALLLGSACGGGGVGDDPKGALLDALNALNASEGERVELTLESTVESLRFLAADDGEDLSEEDAQKILDSSLTIAGREGETPQDGQALVVLNIAGTDAVELRVVDRSFFVRVDAEGLMEELDQDPAQLQAFAQQATAAGFTFAQPAIEGEWLTIKGLDKLAQQAGGSPPPEAARAQEIFNEFEAAIREDARVEAGDKEGPGDHLVIEIPLRETYQRFLDDIANLGARIPVGDGFPDVSEVPDESITVDAWVEDDRLTQIELDIKQFEKFAEKGDELPEGVKRLALRLAIDEFTDEVEAPKDAVEIDPRQLMQAFFGAAMGQAGASSGAVQQQAPSQIDCSQLKGAPPEVIQQFAEQCPQLVP